MIADFFFFSILSILLSYFEATLIGEQIFRIFIHYVGLNL